MQLRVLLLVVALALLPLAFARVHHRQPASSSVIDSSNVDAALSDLDLTAQFHSFKRAHNKVYESAEHEAHRFGIFKENVAKAAALSKKNPTAKFGINKFSDLHELEFKKQYLNYQPPVGDAAITRKHREVRKATRHAVKSVPTAFDWRAPGGTRPVAVTAVKDQGQCGSCWAFSATEETESAWILAGNDPVILAPQQTVDCDTVDSGCNGGDTVTAYTYIEANGIQTEASYPYTSGLSGSAGTCAYNASAVAAKIKGFTYATPSCDDSCESQDEAQLAESLYNVAPVSICVDASTWQTYTSGVLTASSGCSSAFTSLDHCVQLVGFGVDASTNQKYWSVRNSWNTDWGEAGYIRLLYGANTCGVADEATIVQAA